MVKPGLRHWVQQPELRQRIGLCVTIRRHRLKAWEGEGWANLSFLLRHSAPEVQGVSIRPWRRSGVSCKVRQSMSPVWGLDAREGWTIPAAVERGAQCPSRAVTPWEGRECPDIREEGRPVAKVTWECPGKPLDGSLVHSANTKPDP